MGYSSRYPPSRQRTVCATNILSLPLYFNIFMMKYHYEFISKHDIEIESNAGGERRGTSASVFPVRFTALIMYEASPAACPSGMLILGKTR